MSTQHTPGPWWVDIHNNVVSSGGLVAFPGIAAGFDQTANASFIASSPDMLEALKGALAAWDRLYPSIPVSEAFEDCEFREMQVVRAAIAKATGSQA